MEVTNTVFNLTARLGKDGKTYYDLVSVEPAPGMRASYRPLNGSVILPGKYVCSKGLLSPSSFPNSPPVFEGELQPVKVTYQIVK